MVKIIPLFLLNGVYVKKLILLFTSLFLCVFLYSQPASAGKVQELILENGLTVFLLENPSDALVHIDYSVRAGFSVQTPKTNGFFKLFTRLIQQSLPQIRFDSVECNSDNSRFTITTTPSQTENLLTSLSQVSFNPQFSDELIAAELAKLKAEVKEEAASMGGFINSAIDSRIFAQTPWKHDSGIYPAVFNRTNEKNARIIIETISEKWFTPQNSALFISGNIDSAATLLTVQKTFGKYYSAAGIPNEESLLPALQNTVRKYVIHNPEFSKDITQVVVQYPEVASEYADLLSVALNNSDSTFKKQVLELNHLNIIGDEYIDVSAAHKKNTSRLIFQTLMQKPLDKKTKINSSMQAEDFVSQVRDSFENITENEIDFAKYLLTQQILQQLENPVIFMEKLSDFWGICQNIPFTENDEQLFSESIDSVTAIRMLYQLEKIQNLEISNLNEIYSQTPFVFVIINSDDYKKNRKEYSDAGYEEITMKNAGWYVQRMQQEIADLYKPEETKNERGYSGSDNGYYERNKTQIKHFVLSNGIPVTAKINDSSDDFVLLLSVNGGKFYSSQNNGFEEVMINLLSSTIQREFYKAIEENRIYQIPEVTAKTDLYTSSIAIKGNSSQIEEICSITANAIIFGEILPAYADRAVSARQYKKRLENGAALNQLYSSLIDTVYGKNQYSLIYETQNDILEDTSYTKILQGYPQLLDARRYEIIFSGKTENELVLNKMLENSFGLLAQGDYRFPKELPAFKLPKARQISVKINHTFLTDIPAEKAGPMPAVLIPTTEFLDPVIFLVKVPELSQKEKDLFNAVLNYLPSVLENEISSNSKIKDTKVSVQLPQYNMDFGLIIFQNVAHTREIDSLYKNSLKVLQSQLQGMQTSQALIQDIKSQWILNQMIDTHTNSGTALLLQKGCELYPMESKTDFYLDSYNNVQSANQKDFIEIMECFPSQPVFKVYSAESKK